MSLSPYDEVEEARWTHFAEQLPADVDADSPEADRLYAEFCAEDEEAKADAAISAAEDRRSYESGY